MRTSSFLLTGLSLCLPLVFSSSRGFAQTYNLSSATSNFDQRTQDNNNPPYTGFYDASGGNGTKLGLYANGGNGGPGSNPQAVGFHRLTSDGSNNPANQVNLQVGQTFSVTLNLSGSQGINGNSVGFTLKNGTTFNSVNDYNSGGRFELSFTGGDTNAAVYDAGGKTTAGLPTFAQFAGGQTYTVTLVSTDEYNFTASNGASVNVRTLGGTAGSAVQSFALFNRGYNNSDAQFSNLSVSNLASIPLTAATGETKTVSGQITNNGATANNIAKLGAGTLTLNNVNPFTGTTTVTGGTLSAAVAGALGSTSAVTVSSGGTLLLGGSGDRVNDRASLTVNSGGTLDTGGTSERFGALTLQRGSTLELGNGTSVLNFSGLTLDRSTGGVFTVNSYTTGTDRLLFDMGYNAATDLSDVQFTGFTTGAREVDLGNGSFEIVPVPEPATVAAGLLALGTLGLSQRRRVWGLVKARRSAKAV